MENKECYEQLLEAIFKEKVNIYLNCEKEVLAKMLARLESFQELDLRRKAYNHEIYNEIKEGQNTFVYLYGNSERGSDVIKYLESLGGRNHRNLDGGEDNVIYFIDNNGIIIKAETRKPKYLWVKDHFKEIKL